MRFLMTLGLLWLVGCSDDCERPTRDPAPTPAPAPDPAAPLPLPLPTPPPAPAPMPAPVPAPLPAPEPSPDPAPAPAPEPGPDDELAELELLINAERAGQKLAIVASDAALACAAAKHAADIGPRGACSHTGSDGSDFASRARACGYDLKAGGEIIACGQGTPRAAVDAWLGSPGHRAIMMDPSQRAMGVGMTDNFWVVIFSGG